MWDKDSGEAYTAVEPPGGAVNGVCVWPGSGLLMLATDAPKVPAFFIPSLGPAPPWCSFLEAVVEDLEAAGEGDAGAVVYDDYRCACANFLLFMHCMRAECVGAILHVDHLCFHRVFGTRQLHVSALELTNVNHDPTQDTFHTLTELLVRTGL